MMFWNLLFLVLPSLVMGQKSEICVAYESSYHVEKGCECLVFESYGGTQGIFTSPNYPLKYPPMTSCILYTFIGDVNETVEISFEYFSLPPPSKNRCSDFIRLYLDLERPEMSSEMKSNFELCGNLSSVDKFYFSTNRSLIIEFHSGDEQPPSSSSSSSNSGFKAFYRFLEKSKFDMREGVQRWSSGCVYEYRSTVLPTRWGSFYSPGFPHPPVSSCRYFFHGMLDEQVIINFTSVQLSHAPLKCASITSYDAERETPAIIIRDGIFDSAKILKKFCGSLKMPEEAVVKSSEENIFVDFDIGLRAPLQGFAANFLFERRKQEIRTPAPPFFHHVTFDETKLKPNRSFVALEQLVQNSPNSANSEDFWAKIFLSSKNHSDCNYSISGSTSERGEISSPGYPRSYPLNQTCRFLLLGQQHQQIQLIFIDFDLRHNASQTSRGSHDCTDVDSLRISSSTSSTHTDDLGVFCGDVKPPGLMVVKGSLAVLMKSTRDLNSGSFRGFRAKFSFISDFGVNSGDQLIVGECSFSYNSSKAQNGSFHSPNYPGLYPRNIVCHYKFYASPQERVEALFSILDVDGILPFCGPETLSDSIELSNFDFPLGDRKLLPLCGSNRETPRKHYKYISDGSFFRITFKSNDRYDATGFRASYRFFPNLKDERSRIGQAMKGHSTEITNDLCLIILSIFTHSFINSFIYSLLHSFINSFINSFIKSFVSSFINSFILSLQTATISFEQCLLRTKPHITRHMNV